MELSVGLDNILRFIRLDYVWRLNYLDVPYEIDRRGLRVALHFTFEIFFEKNLDVVEWDDVFFVV